MADLAAVGAMAGAMGTLGAIGSYWGIGAVASRPGRRLVSRGLLSTVPTAAPLVALTFDDGPHPVVTPAVAEILGPASSTFFVLGVAVRRHPEVAAALVAAGHEVASHGDSHTRLTHLPPRATCADLRRGAAAIAEATGVAPAFYRPPHGLFNLAAWWAAPRLGMRRTLWSASTRDWDPAATPEAITRAALAAARPGAVILLHDGGRDRDGTPRATLVALPAILDGLAARGLSPVTLSALCATADLEVAAG